MSASGGADQSKQFLIICDFNGYLHGVIDAQVAFYDFFKKAIRFFLLGKRLSGVKNNSGFKINFLFLIGTKFFNEIVRITKLNRFVLLGQG